MKSKHKSSSFSFKEIIIVFYNVSTINQTEGSDVTKIIACVCVDNKSKVNSTSIY